jgi:hypothetical protein
MGPKHVEVYLDLQETLQYNLCAFVGINKLYT